MQDKQMCLHLQNSLGLGKRNNCVSGQELIRTHSENSNTERMQITEALIFSPKHACPFILLYIRRLVLLLNPLTKT